MDGSLQIHELINFILAILVMIAIGYVLKRKSRIGTDYSRFLNALIINITLPAFIFNAVSRSHIDLGAFKISALAFLISAACAVFAWLIGRLMHIPAATLGAFILAAMAGNTGYLGFPITEALFGQGEVFKAIIYDLAGTVLVVFTIGYAIAAKLGSNTGSGPKTVDILVFPPVLAFIAALAIPAEVLPDFIKITLGYLGPATVPLIMLSIGLSLHLTAWRQYAVLIAATVVIKLILSPFLAAAGAKALGITGTTASIAIMEASMPTALITSVFALHYDLDNTFLPAAILATTLASVVTVPAVLFLIR